MSTTSGSSAGSPASAASPVTNVPTQHRSVDLTTARRRVPRSSGLSSTTATRMGLFRCGGSGARRGRLVHKLKGSHRTQRPLVNWW